MRTRRPGKGSTRLRAAITPTFGRQFVMPLPAQFRTACPGIELIPPMSIPRLDVAVEQADTEVRFGAGGHARLEQRLICDVATSVFSVAPVRPESLPS